MSRFVSSKYETDYSVATKMNTYFFCFFLHFFFVRFFPFFLSVCLFLPPPSFLPFVWFLSLSLSLFPFTFPSIKATDLVKVNQKPSACSSNMRLTWAPTIHTE